jgi:two-component system sensor histidine kinase KdpD
MLEQILQNLIDNAAKYTPEGSHITIAYSTHESGYCVHIRDNGPGIPEEKLESIFDKYARLQHKDSKVAGTGLGLAIVKAVMEEQGGSVLVRNHEQGGAEFTLLFPVHRQAEAAA